MWKPLQKIVDFFRNQTTVVEKPGSLVAEIQRQLAGGVSTPDDALAIPQVWRAVHLVASSVAQVPLHLYRRGESREQVLNGMELDLLARPGPGVTQYTFRRTLTLHTLLCGNGYAWINRSAKRLILLDPLQTQPVERRNRLYWETQFGGPDSAKQIPDDDVLHLCGLSWDGLQGISAVQKFSGTFDLPRCMCDHARGFFLRGTMLSGFLKTPRPLTAEERAELQRAFGESFGGASQSWKVPVLGGGLEWQSATVEPQKTQLPELHQSATRDIAAVFGLPSHKLGDPAKTSYASLEQENLEYLMFSLESWLAAWEAELNVKLCPSGCYWEHNRNALVRSVYSDRVQGYYRLVEMGVLSPNEVRRMENLPARQGGDTYYAPANWIDQGKTAP